MPLNLGSAQFDDIADGEHPVELIEATVKRTPRSFVIIEAVWMTTGGAEVIDGMVIDAPERSLGLRLGTNRLIQLLRFAGIDPATIETPERAALAIVGIRALATIGHQDASYRGQTVAEPTVSALTALPAS
jgi:hypothetical protein